MAIRENGGEGGIRTHGTGKGTHAFQAGSLSHSDTSPQKMFEDPVYFEGSYFARQKF